MNLAPLRRALRRLRPTTPDTPRPDAAIPAPVPDAARPTTARPTTARHAAAIPAPVPDVAPHASAVDGTTAGTPQTDSEGAVPTRPAVPRPSRAVRLGALVAAVVVLATGTVAVARAHKTVTLEVDGETQQVATFAGSVAGLLADEGVDLGSRDIVAPAVDAGLSSGDEVVVRHARALTVLTDGDETTVWTTALSADEALASLATRGDDVRLVASRSGGGARADLSLRLRTTGPVQVVVDGRTERVADGSTGLAAVLRDAGVSLARYDRVTVQPSPGSGEPLTVVVQRVVVREETLVAPVPFETLSAKTADLYRGQSRTATEGVAGELTSQHRVVVVDGVEESRLLLSERVTREPVAAVVQHGTRPRPSAGGSVSLAGVWDRLAQCESGGNPRAVSSNGLYYGLFQFSLGTWRGVGGSGLPTDASPAEQLQRAQALQARSGWGQWPACARKLGLL